jgi:hypothetical protein
MTPDWLHDNAHRLTQPAGMAVSALTEFPSCSGLPLM